MTTELHIDLNHTAVLVMDYQNEIVDLFPTAQDGLLDRAAAVLRGARDVGIPVVYVVVGFRDGYPEISAKNKSFSGMKAAGRLKGGTDGVEVHSAVAPQPGEVVVTKRRVGAFTTTDMETVLKAKDVTTLVLLGISTSGVVLSTVRWAADADYRLVVLADCCTDNDEEVHRVLTKKIFLSQATVMNSTDFLQAIGRS